MYADIFYLRGIASPYASSQQNQIKRNTYEITIFHKATISWHMCSYYIYNKQIVLSQPHPTQLPNADLHVKFNIQKYGHYFESTLCEYIELK